MNATDAKCLKEYGWDRRGRKCARVQQPESTVVNTKRGGNNILLATGLTSAGAMGLVAGLPLMELASKNKVEPGGKELPLTGVPADTLNRYKQEFKPGDLLRQKNTFPGGLKAYHYAVYVGVDGKTNLPTMIHVNPLEKGGVGVVIDPMNKKPIGKGFYEYELAPKEERIEVSDFDERLKKIEPLIGRTLDFNIFDKNCETFARGLLSGKMETKQVDRISGLSRWLGRNIYGRPISILAAKEGKTETTYAEIEKVLNQQIKTSKQGDNVKKDSFDQDLVSPSWEAYKKGESLISLEEAIRIARSYPPLLQSAGVYYLKGYLLYRLIAKHLSSLSMESTKNDSGKAMCSKEHGWKRQGDKCARVKAKQPQKKEDVPKKKRNRLGQELAGALIGLGIVGGIAGGSVLLSRSQARQQEKKIKEEWDAFEQKYKAGPKKQGSSGREKQGTWNEFWDEFEQANRGSKEEKENFNKKWKTKMEGAEWKAEAEFRRWLKEFLRKHREAQREQATGSGKPSSQESGQEDWFYSEMGLGRDASPSEVRKKYRDLAQKYHPDKTKDPAAEEKMKRINAAYDTWKRRQGRSDSYWEGMDCANSIMTQYTRI